LTASPCTQPQSHSELYFSPRNYYKEFAL